MPTSSKPTSLLVNLLGALPLQLADGLVLLESDVTECLVVQIFEQTITLPTRLPAKHDDVVEVVFEGSALDIANIANLCTLSFPHLRMAIHSSPSASISVDVTGRAHLELRGVAAFGADSLVIAGNVRLVTADVTGASYLRIDFDETRASLPLPGGAALSIMPRNLFFSVDDDASAILEMRVACSLAGLPPWIQEACGETTFEAEVRWTEDGAILATRTVREGWRIPLPSFDAFGGSPAWKLEEMTISAKYLRINIGQNIECSLDIGVHVPSILRDVMESHLDLRLSTVGDEVRVHLLSSPFRGLDCARVPNGNLRARMRVGEGKISFDLPMLRIDWARRCIVAEGHVSHKDIRIPLAPLRTLLEGAGMHGVTKHLPDSIPFQSFGLTGVAAAFSNLIADALRKGTLVEKARDVVEQVWKNLDLLPPRLRDEYLRVHVPTEIAFRFECTFDFDARVHLAPSNDPAEAEASPIRFLVPFLGGSGPELLGITLYRWAFGELRAGQMWTMEVDAEVDRFELLPLGLATTLGRGGSFASPHEMQSRIMLRDVVTLCGVAGGTPWLVPLSFRKIGWTYAGVDGVAVGLEWGFSAPNIDFARLFHWFIRVREGSIDGSEMAGFECHVGPAYVRLPRCVGGEVLGTTEEMISLQTPEELKRVVLAWQTLDTDRLLETIPFGVGQRDIDIEVGSEYRNAAEVWTKVAAPILLVAQRSEGTGGKGLGDKWRGWTAGLRTPRKDEAGNRYRVHLDRVTRQSIHLRADLPDIGSNGTNSVEIELQWEDPWGSMARWLARLGA